MATAICELAIEDALECGKALLKFLTPNEVDPEQSNQDGYYLPKGAAQHFTPHKPIKGTNETHPVKICWQGDFVTDSNVKWYGKAKSEYRITKFGRNFPYGNNADLVGDLLVIVPKNLNEFNAYVLDLEDDIEEIHSALGLRILGDFTFFEKGKLTDISIDECIDERFRKWVENLKKLPTGIKFTEHTLETLAHCYPNFSSLGIDDRLLRAWQNEFKLFELAERKVFSAEVMRLFKSIDDFIATAKSIMNSRKARAGRALENHVEVILKQSSIPYQRGVMVDRTRPDFVIPNTTLYPKSYSDNCDIMIVGVKTTCKDRWRQVLREAPNVGPKYIFTLQEGISSKQVAEMSESKVQLIVPREYHTKYPRTVQSQLWDVDEFISRARTVASG